MRLDFDIFVLEHPSDALETSGGSCPDTLKLTTSNGDNSPSICGTNTGQHMYMNVGPDSGAYLTIAITPSTTTTSTTRTWEIKVSQYLCKDRDLPPAGCLQWFVGHAGRWKTYNFDASSTSNQQHIASQRYDVCIRPEEGACCIAYIPCADETASWSLDQDGSSTAAETGSDCTADYLGITGATNECVRRPGASLTSRICGDFWTADTQASVVSSTYATSTTVSAVQTRVCDCSPPFVIEVNTDAAVVTAGTTNGAHRGACLDFTQIPCAS